MKRDIKELRMIDKFMGYYKPDGVTGVYESWDELMKVVITLESLGYTVSINKNVCSISIPNKDPLKPEDFISFGYEDSKFESTRTACITAINHHNSKK